MAGVCPCVCVLVHLPVHTQFSRQSSVGKLKPSVGLFEFICASSMLGCRIQGQDGKSWFCFVLFCFGGCRRTNLSHHCALCSCTGLRNRKQAYLRYQFRGMGGN